LPERQAVDELAGRGYRYGKKGVPREWIQSNNLGRLMNTVTPPVHETVDPRKAIALFSADGESWSGPTPETVDCSFVTKIVIGKADQGKTKIELASVAEKLVLNLSTLGTQFENLTHLHLWGIEGLEMLVGLPTGLKCLDVRHCTGLETIESLPETLETLILEENGSLTCLPEICEPLVLLTDLDLAGCSALTETSVHRMLASCPNLRRFDASRIPAITIVEEWPIGLEDVRLNDCAALQTLPGWPSAGKLRRLELRSTAIEEFSDFPASLDYVDLGAMTCLTRLPDRWPAPEATSPRTLFLFGSALLMPPASEQGETANENVAARTRAYFEDLEIAGPGDVKRCKLLILGNGGAGKTCLSLNISEGDPKRTCEKYEPEKDRIKSTHGVQFHDFSIKARVGAKAEDVHLHLWDFGGQEIYHNTHRLFMGKGAVFVVVWDPDQVGKQPPPKKSGFQDRWRPLSYWLDYIDLACPHDAKIAIVCATKRERSKSEITALLEKDGSPGIFERHSCYFIDSFEKKGDIDGLKGWLRDSVGWVVGTQGTAVPSYWEIAQEMVDEWVRKIDSDPLFAAAHQQLEFKAFGHLLEAKCKEIVMETDPDCFTELTEAIRDRQFQFTDDRIRRTLSFLSHSGWVYWDPALLNERVIVGQKWALEGIYTLLKREDEHGDGSRIYLQLTGEARNGRFTLEDLNRWGWAESLPDGEDQELILSFMEKIGLCFRILKKEDSLWEKPVYQSLAHLRNADRREWKRKLYEGQDALASASSSPEDDRCRFRNPSLHEGHWHMVLTSLGEQFGRDAEYRKDGFYAATADDQKVMILADINEVGLGGEFTIDVVGPHSKELEKSIRSAISDVVGGHIQRVTVDTNIGEAVGKPSERVEMFVSYTWEPWDSEFPTDYTAPVDAIQGALQEEPVTVLRDVDMIESKDSVTAFMEQIAKTDKVLIVHSDKYWQSFYCMWELWRLIHSFKLRGANFAETMILIEHPTSGIRDAETKKSYLDHWKDKKKKGFPTRLEKVCAFDDLKRRVESMFIDDFPEFIDLEDMYRKWGDDDESKVSAINWVKDQLGLNPPVPTDSSAKLGD